MAKVAGWPISSPYGPRARGDGFHDGVDIDCDHGTGLFTASDARLRSWEHDLYGWVLDVHFIGSDWSMRLAHLSKRLFADGERVRAGALIARSGGRKGAPGSGNSTGDHLHYELRWRGRLLDPMEEPMLAEAIFNGGFEMTKDEIRDLIEQENGQLLQMLAAELSKQAKDGTGTPLARVARALRATGIRIRRHGRK